MKLTIDTDSNQVVSAVAEKTTLERVSQATHVFLGTAIGLGFVASAMGFFLLPGLQSRIPSPIRNIPLQVTDVVRAVSIRDPLETVIMPPQEYLAGGTVVYSQVTQFSSADRIRPIGGKNEALKIRLQANPDANTNTGSNANTNPNTNSNIFSLSSLLGVKTAHAQATTFSIEPIPFAGLTSQYILIWYRQVGDTADRLMTLCLGQTSATTVYVGSDGSTYTDSNLRNRTTARSCDQLNQMNRGVEQVSEGTASIVPTNHGRHDIVKSARILGRFDEGVFQASDPIATDPVLVAQVIANFHSPTIIGFAPATDGENNYSTVIPPAIFKLVDTQTNLTQPVTQYLCQPGATLNTTTLAPVFFFDRDGNAYRDLFLTERMESANCPGVIARSFKVEDVTALSATPSAWSYGSVYLYHGQTVLGQLSSSDLPFPTFTDGEKVTNPIGPLSVVAARNSGDPMSGSVPDLQLTLTGTRGGQGMTQQLCYPQTVIPEPTPDRTHLKFYFYDATGTPYADLFLTTPVACPVSVSGAGSLSPTETQ